MPICTKTGNYHEYQTMGGIASEIGATIVKPGQSHATYSEKTCKIRVIQCFLNHFCIFKAPLMPICTKTGNYHEYQTMGGIAMKYALHKPIHVVQVSTHPISNHTSC